jgi:quercetin dioxygenase-like cupin family protein
MDSWKLTEIQVQARQPQVLASDDEGRAIVLELPAGERLQEHQVHERAWLLVISGRIEVSEPNGEAVNGGPGLLVIFEPNERHEVAASQDSRLLLVLSPWPGDGHPSNPGP